MPIYSATTPFGQLEYSKRPSKASQLFTAIRKTLGKNYLEGDMVGEPDALQDGRSYAWARGMARTRMLLRRAGNQHNPLKMLEHLPTAEKLYGLVPLKSQTEDERRTLLALRVELPRGANFNAIENALIAALGSDFVAYRPTPEAEAGPIPSGDPTLGPGDFASVDTFHSFAPTVTAVTTTGSPVSVVWNPAQGFNVDSQTTFPVGTQIVIDPDKDGLRELVTVAAPTLGALFTATFTKAHAAGAWLKIGGFPYYLSTRKHQAIIVVNGKANDPEVRRLVQGALERGLRGISTWDVLHENAVAGTAGPFNVGGGSSPGLIGTTPIGLITF
jgi:hypothetical protein